MMRSAQPAEPGAAQPATPTTRARSFSLRRLRSRSATGSPSGTSEADRPPVPGLASSHGAAASAPAPVPPVFPSASAERYTACYCEENVYRLCAELSGELAHRNAAARASGDSQRWDAWAVVVSSIDKRVSSVRGECAAPASDAQQAMLWRQRASSDVHGRVMWDYHVFLLVSCARLRTVSRAQRQNVAPTAKLTGVELNARGSLRREQRALSRGGLLPSFAAKSSSVFVLPALRFVSASHASRHCPQQSASATRSESNGACNARG